MFLVPSLGSFHLNLDFCDVLPFFFKKLVHIVLFEDRLSVKVTYKSVFLNAINFGTGKTNNSIKYLYSFPIFPVTLYHNIDSLKQI